MQKNNLIVKEPEELILMRGDFSESALKLGAYLIANLEKDKVIYKINIREYLEKFDKKIGNYNYLYNITKELSQKQFEIKDRFNERFAIFNFISSVTYADGILEVEFSQKLLVYLLEIKEKYLKYDIKNIMSLSSKYAIRLYKILKDAYEKNSRYNNKAELKMSVNEFRQMLEIPKSYQYSSGIKKRILEKAKAELEEHTDILFEYEEIKTGRKVTHLHFYIRQNPKNIQTDNRLQENYFKSRKAFVTLLRKNYSGNKKLFGWKTLPEKNYNNYWLGLDRDGLVYGWLDGDIVDFNAVESAKIYDIWLKFAQNSDLYKQMLEQGEDIRNLAVNNKELWLNLINDFKRCKEERII